MCIKKYCLICDFLFIFFGKIVLIKLFFVFLDENSSGKSMKKPRRSPFSIFRRGKDDKNNNSSPTGKLFGRPIDDLVIDGGLPKAVMVRETVLIILSLLLFFPLEENKNLKYTYEKMYAKELTKKQQHTCICKRVVSLISIKDRSCYIIVKGFKYLFEMKRF